MNILPGGKGKKAGVAGMGRSGAAAARLLSSRGYSVIGFDSSPSAEPVEHLDDLILGRPGVEELKALDLLVLSPGIPLDSSLGRTALEAGITVTGEIELAWRCTDADIIAVTGSNGKTTTVEWTGHVLKRAEGLQKSVVAGNMGYALSDAVIDHPDCPLFTLELSSYQLETISRMHPVSAAFLNLTPDHLARHGTMERYGDAKARMFMNQTALDTAVLNMDDPGLIRYRKSSAAQLMLFSLTDRVVSGAWMDKQGMLRLEKNGESVEIVQAKDLALPGRHNIANALAVICLCGSYGVAPEEISQGLPSFRGVPHRIESLGTARDLIWVNDSKSTNVDSLKVALESFAGKVILLAGGEIKNSDYSVLGPLMKKSVKLAVLFGSAAESLRDQWAGFVEMEIAEDLEEAVKNVLSRSKAGDTVLLSPGCASFDQYRNFEERGEHFRKIVGGLS